MVATSKVNVRLEPDGSSDAVTDIAIGSVIRVKAEQGDWLNVVVNGRDDLWIKSRNRVKSMVGPAPADAAARVTTIPRNRRQQEAEAEGRSPCW